MRKEGGLRTKGLFIKKSEPLPPLLTIVTACLNDEKHLEECIKSVINQTYDNIEYIIVDGGSTDGTIEIVKRYEDKIAYWISEPDRGFYDALNKANALARGDYILYINSDDYLYSENSIKDFLHLAFDDKNFPLLIVGKVQIAFKDRLLNWIWPPNEKAIHRYNPPHQAVLIHKNIYKEMPYMYFFKSAGDTELWMRLREQGLFKFKYIDYIISVFRLGGISNRINMEYRRYTEREIINFLYSKINLFGFILRLLKGIALITLKRILISVLGERIYYAYILYGIYFFRRKFLVR